MIYTLQWAYPFKEPVDTKRYDNYLNYVKRPMDLGTIKRGVEAGAYKAPDDLLADVQQVPTSLRFELKAVPHKVKCLLSCICCFCLQTLTVCWVKLCLT